MADETNSLLDEVQAEVSALDAFLSVDPNRPKSTVRMHVQSLGAAVTIRELEETEINMILQQAEDAAQKAAQGAYVNQVDMHARIVAMGMVDPNLRDLLVMDKLHKKFGTGQNPERVVLTVLKPLEITKLANKIMEISGMGDDAVTEAGN